MESSKRAKQMARVLGALLAEIRDHCGHEVAAKLFASAIEKGQVNGNK